MVYFFLQSHYRINKDRGQAVKDQVYSKWFCVTNSKCNVLHMQGQTMFSSEILSDIVCLCGNVLSISYCGKACSGCCVTSLRK